MPKKIRYVDGFFIRNHLDLEFGIVEEYAPSGLAKKYIPKNEIWIDKHYKKETPEFLKFNALYHDKRYDKMSYHQWRKLAKEKFMEPGPVPPLVMGFEKKGSLTIEYVNGIIIRKYIDPDFIFGGHKLVYDYIPHNKIWIDAQQDEREIPYTLLHEIKELELMKKEMNYDAAHDIAAAFEKAERRKDGVASYPGDENFHKKFILPYARKI